MQQDRTGELEAPGLGIAIGQRLILLKICAFKVLNLSIVLYISTMEKASRIFFGFWTLAFVLFAYWQFNDPDPEVWVSIYAYAAIMSGLAATERYPLVLLLAGTVLFLLGAVYFFPASVSEWVMQEWHQQDLSMKSPEMEEARESFGLLIVSIITGTAAWLGWRKKQLSGRLKASA